MLKKIFVFFIFLFSYFFGISGTTSFITTWKTNNTGVSLANQITIPTFPGEIYNYTVDWGDGSAITQETGEATHTYSTTGEYTVSITGDFPRIYFNNQGDRSKLLSIDQWGDNVWSSMEGAFYGCEFMQGNFTDIPDLSLVTSMAEMFRETQNFNSPINSWDVSTVQNMSSLFQNASNFNQPIGNWIVDNVTDMSNMFNNFIEGTTIEMTITPVDGTAFSNSTREVAFTGVFNQDIGDWNVNNVENMSGMFVGIPFNQNISNWNVSNVKNMSNMFYVAISFDQDLSNWNVAQVTDMSYMFGDALSFDSDIGNWNVSNVTTMRGMFSYAVDFNQNLNNWSIDSVTDIGEMFSSASSFNQDLSNWDVKGVVFMDATFDNADIFNQDISGWDVSNVVTMRTMFLGADAFDQNLNSWEVGNVIDFAGMFAFITNYNHPLYNWDMSKAIDLSAMFGFAETFNQDLSSWNVSNVEEMRFMFYQAFDFNQDIGDWNVESLVTAVNMFTGVTLSVENYDSLLIGWESNIINFDVPFDGGLSQYCAGEDARSRMINISNWSIIDAGAISFSVNGIPRQTEEYSFTFPEITGVNLTGNEAYYTESNAEGTRYEIGDVLVFSETEIYPINIYIYDETLAKFPCVQEEQFQLTLTLCGSSIAPLIDNYNVGIVDHSFTFPEITGVNLTGEEAYYIESNGQGTKYIAGDIIYFKDNPSYPITIYVYDQWISANSYTCEDEQEFLLTITETLPLCTELRAPFNGEVNVSVNTSSIEWEPVYNADGYLLSITTTSGNEIVNNIDTSDTVYEFLEELPSAEEIFVTITPYNSIGSALDCGNQSFKIEPNIQFPKFFTPNNDGINDQWTVPNPFNSFDKAFIYDRYGRLINQIIDPDSKGWDGTFAGKPLPSSDYWYKVLYSTGEVFVGNFTLIR